jgi:hypothetical protein
MTGCDAADVEEERRERKRERKRAALVIDIADGVGIFGSASDGIKMSRSDRAEAIRVRVDLTRNESPYLVSVLLLTSRSLPPSTSQAQTCRVYTGRVAQHAPALHPSQPASGRDSGITARGPIRVHPAVIRRVARLPTVRIHC